MDRPLDSGAVGGRPHRSAPGLTQRGPISEPSFCQQLAEATDRLAAAAARVAGEPEPRLALGVVGAALAIAVVLLMVAASLTSVRAFDRAVATTLGQPLDLPAFPQRSTIHAADGSVLSTVYLDYNRHDVSLRQISPIARKAVLAIEDHEFYRHGALDFPAIVRAFLIDLEAGRVLQGGSTIAQQLAKNAVTGDARSLSRKVREAEAAIRLEHTYAKSRILDMYLNEVYLGHSVYGMAAAAEFYFAERANRLTLPQAALLAGMIQSPAYFDPIAHPVHSRSRRDFVLERMRALGWIGPARYGWAVSRPILLSARERHVAAPGPNSYWTQFVTDSFLSDPAFGRTYRERVRALYQGGLKIYTTLDSARQAEADQAIRNRMTGPGMPQSAVVSIVPQTGAIEAMAVGNWPYGTHRYDLATDPGGGRTAGSAFKVFTLAAALEQGISPFAVYSGDSPRTIPNCGSGADWTVANAEPGSGSYPLYLAAADSVNAVFAQVIDEVGPDAVAHVAHRMGITSPLTPVCPLTLGTSPVSPLEMTSAYATLANGGVHCVPYAINRVVSATGQTIMETTPRCAKAIPADVATEETAILEGVVAFGTGTAADIGRPQAGKTGTGQNYQDAWFLGFVPQLATGVWVGYARSEAPMFSVPGYGAGFGGVVAAPIWHDYMAAATRDLPALDFPPPPTPIPGIPIAPSLAIPIPSPVPPSLAHRAA